MDNVKLLVADLLDSLDPRMGEEDFLEIIRKHGFTLCNSRPVGWAAHANVLEASEHGGVIGLGSDEGAVVYNGETWMNADQPLFCSA